MSSELDELADRLERFADVLSAESSASGQLPEMAETNGDPTLKLLWELRAALDSFSSRVTSRLDRMENSLVSIASLLMDTVTLPAKIRIEIEAMLETLRSPATEHSQLSDEPR